MGKEIDIGQPKNSKPSKLTVKELRAEWLRVKWVQVKGKPMAYWYSPVLKGEYIIRIEQCYELMQKNTEE